MIVEQNVEQTLREIKAIFAVDGMIMSEEEIETSRAILEGRTTAEAETRKMYERFGVPYVPKKVHVPG